MHVNDYRIRLVVECGIYDKIILYDAGFDGYHINRYTYMWGFVMGAMPTPLTQGN